MGAFYLQGGESSFSFHADRVTVRLGCDWGDGGGLASAYDVVFDGANRVTPVGIDPTGTVFNYFLGNDPSRWVTGARGFSGIRYEGLWDGVDLVYRLLGGALKYELIVAPGASVSDIRMTYEGTGPLAIDDGSGRLLIGTSSGVCMDDRPVSFQTGPQGRVSVGSAFQLHGPRSVGFRVDDYDHAMPLTIDPDLLFSTFIGSPAGDYAEACRIGPDGSLFILGISESGSFPTTTNAYDDGLNGGYDVVVSRLSSDGSSLLYSTFIGGSGGDNAPYSSQPYDVYAGFGGIWVDDLGAVYVTGHTVSGDFPVTSGAFDTTYSNSIDGFALKLAPSGQSLEFSTYVGGTKNDHPIDVCVDSHGNAIIVGVTVGDFPTTPGTVQPSFGGGPTDAFVCMVNASGDKLLYSTYLGGASNDVAYAVAIGPDGLACVAGYTQGSGFPVRSGAYDTTHNGNFDMFVLRLDSTWTDLEYSTYIGASNGDYPVDIILDDIGRAFVLGFTLAGGFPVVTGGYDGSYNGDIDIILLRLSDDGSALQKCTYYGTSSEDKAYSLALAPDGDVVICGFSKGNVPTTADAYDSTNNGGWDAFAARFDADLSILVYGSIFGSSGDDKSWELAIDSDEGTVFLVGHTTGAGFPSTSGTYDDSHNGGADIFALKLGELHPPRWLALPTLAAVEDIEVEHNLSSYVSDADTPLDGLSLSSTSPFVVGTSGLNATFLFPNGVTSAGVPLTLRDGFASAQAIVNFTIEPVNDPPRCTVPSRHYATEDVPYTVDFGMYVTDVDNAMDELGLLVDSQYASVTGLNLTVTYPEGVLSDVIWANVTDGLLAVEARLEFTVTPVDDPPVVLPLPPFLAVEDRLSVFNISPYLQDVDTPIDMLRVMALDANCSVVDKELQFLFHLPIDDLNVTVEVADSHTRVTATLLVSVTPVNDPPVVGTVSPQVVVEGEPCSIDLSPYVMDEDTPEEGLVLTCQSPHFVEATGLNLILLYDEWQPEQTVEFSIFDGIAYANGSLTVQVQAVNDPPVILGIGPYDSPVVVSLLEGEELWLAIRVSDEDSTVFRYSVTTMWNGVNTFQNGTVRLTTVQADVGEHYANVTVDDLSGGRATMMLRVVVGNVDDPPTAPILASPVNHTTVEEGTNVTFRVDVSDPDTALGQVLTITWVSNISGLLRSLASNQSLTFTTNALPVGVHRVDVTVTDGTHVTTAWLELTVIERYVPPPPPPEDPSFLARPTGIATILIVIVLVIVVVLLGVSWTRRRLKEREAAEEERARAEAARQRQAEANVEITMGGDLARLSHDLGDMVSKLEAQRAAEASVTAPPAPAPVLESIVTKTTEEEEADRERTREMREVMRALTQLPQGLPTSLSGWDMAELAGTIVDGEKRSAADGTPLVLIRGKWYCADRTNVGTFAREWKEPAPAPGGPLTDAERAARLEKLESALLEGKISEATYKELKAKYEKG